ncbi:THO complex subunit 1 transcription elongation factor-domain-containing protein [Xylariaceae sp. FL0255]|nr:THO complex subunit 1 transcription elongation factor-domain-containing protein [Xylariaceae sp. FL0255]
MPSLRLVDDQVPQVSAMAEMLEHALDHARAIKPNFTIEPPLTKSHFQQLLSLPPQTKDADKTRLFATVETAARKIFSSTVASTSIASPEFVQIWNLFDILSILSDNEQCDPALLFWLVEELLDSQTVEACRKVFDFLESRRERITAKNLKQKSLVILRSCNDLLRRLSRAEDAAFCGRVYIFMFQSIPPGDRSSVNLRGEYHVENVTSFDDKIPSAAENGAADKMDVDNEADPSKDENKGDKPKAVSFDSKSKSDSEKRLDADALYPVFWSLQHFFSQPTTLFDAAELAKFKNGIQATLDAFDAVEKIQKNPKSSDENKIIPQKRKITQTDEELRSTNHNPKYLTSRDLFELEISDLYFRRHILIQAFIILDFLLSLTPQARAKIANVQQNRSVVYADKNLGEDDAKWAKGMKDRITNYIQQDTDGFFFFRVVESVISRDKGWVRWKVENCPPIERSSVSADVFIESRSNAKRLATSRRPKAGMNSLPLTFMDEKDSSQVMEELKASDRWKLPPLEDFQKKIANDDLDLEMARDEKEKTELLESKASKTWRALRIARRSRLAAFDKVDDWQKVDAIFQDQQEEDETKEAEETGLFPQNKRPIILSGPHGAGKSTLSSMLRDKQRGVFEKIPRHTTRTPREGEINGLDFHFVDSKTFNTILDGDYFLESDNRDGMDYGTNRRLVDALEESGKVAIIHLEREGTQSAKDNGFSARVVFIKPPSLEELEARLRKVDGMSDEDIQTKLKGAREEIDNIPEDLFDKVIMNDNIETAFRTLEEYIYETSALNGVNGTTNAEASKDGDVDMEDREAAVVTGAS